MQGSVHGEQQRWTAVSVLGWALPLLEHKHFMDRIAFSVSPSTPKRRVTGVVIWVSVSTPQISVPKENKFVEMV